MESSKKMTKVRALLVAVAVALVGFSIDATSARPAQAAWPPVIYVNENLPSDWPVYDSVRWLDGYTHHSYFRWGACRAGYRCVTFKVGTLGGGYVGWTTNWANGRSVITVDVAKSRRSPYNSYYGWYTRRYLLDHELGTHAIGQFGHGGSCSSRSYPVVRCGGHVPYRSWTYTERQKLYQR